MFIFSKTYTWNVKKCDLVTILRDEIQHHNVPQPIHPYLQPLCLADPTPLKSSQYPREEAKKSLSLWAKNKNGNEMNAYLLLSQCL